MLHGKIYIHHYTKLTDRKAYLSNAFSQMDFNSHALLFRWMDEFDRETIDPKYQTWYKPDLIREGFRENFLVFSASESERCVAVSHIEAYRDFDKLEMNTPTSVMFSFEDDVIFQNPARFLKQAEETIAKLPDNWDILFLGSDKKIDNPDNINPTPYENPYSRWGDSYVVSADGVKKILESVYADSDEPKFMVAPDQELNWHIRNKNLKSFWLDYPITYQGSFNGEYAGVVQRG